MRRCIASVNGGRIEQQPNTVSFHMRRIYDKLYVHTKSDAVAKALRNQIVG